MNYTCLYHNKVEIQFSLTTVLCNMYETEKERIDEAHEEVSEGLNLLGMADVQNDGRGMHSKDHTRKWTTISVCGHASHAAKKTGKIGQKSWQRNRNWKL